MRVSVCVCGAQSALFTACKINKQTNRKKKRWRVKRKGRRNRSCILLVCLAGSSPGIGGIKWELRMTSRQRTAAWLVKCPSVCASTGRVPEPGCGRRGGKGGSLVRFYWSAGEEPLVHGCRLAGKQDSDGLCSAAIWLLPDPRCSVCVCVCVREKQRREVCVFDTRAICMFVCAGEICESLCAQGFVGTCV